MKKTIAVVLTLTLLLSAGLLAGCGKKLDAYELRPYATVRFDPADLTANGVNFTAADESWTCTIQMLDTPQNKGSADLRYRAHKAGMQKDRMLNRVFEEKQLGGIKYEAFTFTEHYMLQDKEINKFQGMYFCWFKPELTASDGTVLPGVFAHYTGPEDKLPAFEAFLSTLEIDAK